MITIEQKRIIDVMKSGVRLCIHHGDEGDEYYFTDGTIPRPRTTSVAALLRMGVVAPSDDGLLPDVRSGLRAWRGRMTIKPHIKGKRVERETQ